MKQKDVLLLAVVIIISGIASTIISSKIVVSPKVRQQQVEVAPTVSPDLPSTNQAYFNSNAYDPSYQIQIGPSTNTNPLNGSQ